MSFWLFRDCPPGWSQTFVVVGQGGGSSGKFIRACAPIPPLHSLPSIPKNAHLHTLLGFPKHAGRHSLDLGRCLVGLHLYTCHEVLPVLSPRSPGPAPRSHWHSSVNDGTMAKSGPGWSGSPVFCMPHRVCVSSHVAVTKQLQTACCS